MAIDFRKYVDITSGVAASGKVKKRELMGRIYTTNPRCPAGGVLELSTLEDVVTLFGDDSEEYKRAAFYLSWVSKTQTRAKKISFVYWPEKTIFAAMRATDSPADIEDFKAVETGSFSITVKDSLYVVENIDLSECVSYTDVANAVQDALYQKGLYVNVAYSVELAAFTMQAENAAVSSLAPLQMTENGTFIGTLLGLDEASSPIMSQSVTAQTVTEALTQSIDKSNNFGSFMFCGTRLTPAQAKEAATVAHASNMRHMFCLGVTEESAEGFITELKGYDGVALTLTDAAHPEDYADMIPMTLLASTDYSRLNGSINYMFHQFPTLRPTIESTVESGKYDAMRVNYYGRTQQAGQYIEFYQRGVLLGTTQDMHIYANEMWLKDSVAVDVMDLLLALPKIGANTAGRGQVIGALQNTISLALNNGAISIGKKLSSRQKAYVLEVTGSDTAWQELETSGYWLTAEVVEYMEDDRVEYKIEYLLLYAKGDVIRKVEGSHSLI